MAATLYGSAGLIMPGETDGLYLGGKPHLINITMCLTGAATTGATKLTITFRKMAIQQDRPPKIFHFR